MNGWILAPGAYASDMGPVRRRLHREVNSYLRGWFEVLSALHQGGIGGFWHGSTLTSGERIGR